jgi:hypothetical protein
MEALEPRDALLDGETFPEGIFHGTEPGQRRQILVGAIRQRRRFH